MMMEAIKTGGLELAVDPSLRYGSTRLAAVTVHSEGHQTLSAKLVSAAHFPAFLKGEAIILREVRLYFHPHLPRVIKAFKPACLHQHGHCLRARHHRPLVRSSHPVSAAIGKPPAGAVSKVAARHPNRRNHSSTIDHSSPGCVLFQPYYGDLFSMVRMHGALPEEVACRLFAQMASAVLHCHSLGIVVRDLRLGNMLFADASLTRVVIADLAHALDINLHLLADRVDVDATESEEADVIVNAPAPLPTSSAAMGETVTTTTTTTTTITTNTTTTSATTNTKSHASSSAAAAAAAATPHHHTHVHRHHQRHRVHRPVTRPANGRVGVQAYTAPEVWTQPEHDGAKADAWSLGVGLYLLLVGSYPFADADHFLLRQKIQTAPLELPLSLSPNAADLLRRLLCRDPAARLSVAEIFQSPWMVASGICFQPQQQVPTMAQPTSTARPVTAAS
jgi:serine/threonine protein kinase